MRHYIDVGLSFVIADIEILAKSLVSDRQFINRILEMAFSRTELSKSSAKGKTSHGKAHKPLHPGRLAFVRCRIITASKQIVMDLRWFFVLNHLSYFRHF